MEHRANEIINLDETELIDLVTVKEGEPKYQGGMDALRHWADNFIAWNVPFFVRKEGDKTILWKRRIA